MNDPDKDLSRIRSQLRRWDSDDIEAGLVVAIQELVGNSARGVLVGQLERLGPEPLDVHNGHQGIRQDAAQRSVGLKVFELAHRLEAY